MRTSLNLAAALTIGLAGSTAMAASFDYGSLFDEDLNGGPPDVDATLAVSGDSLEDFGFEAAYSTHSWTVDGITMTATAEEADGTAAFAYGDAASGGKHAGLGVILNVNASGGYGSTQTRDVGAPSGSVDYVVANPGSADNAKIGEIVILTASEKVNFNLEDTTFVDAGHNPLTIASSNVQIQIDDSGTWSDVSLATVMGTKFEFRIDPTTTSGNKEFYISVVTATSVIPLPAAAWMGISMLGGLGAVKKLRNRVTG